MVPTLAQMRAECVRHYESKGYSPEWAERVVYANRKLIPSVYAIIQAEQQGTAPPYPPIETEADEETAAEWAAVFFLSKSQGERKPKFLAEAG